MVKSNSLTVELPLILVDLNLGGGQRIPGVEVKFVDIGRNTSGEGAGLDED